MSQQEGKSERLTAAGDLAVVVAPCLIAYTYYLALGYCQTAMLYAASSLCCDLPLSLIYERVKFVPDPEMPALELWQRQSGTESDAQAKETA